MIPVIWKSYREEIKPRGDHWDQAMLEDVFSRDMWHPAYANKFKHFEYDHDLGFAENLTGGIIVIAARHHVEYIHQINKDINKLEWCILILIGDEEQTFPVEKIKHPNCKIYIMLPHLGKNKNVDRFIPNGYPPQAKMIGKFTKEAMERPLNWFFAGQNTHERRTQCIEQLRTMAEGYLVETKGFTQGLPHEEYYRNLVSAKIAPCPSGAVIPDSFRLYEALEAGCLPIVDGYGPQSKDMHYWEYLFGEFNLPFPILYDWIDLVGTLQYHVDTYPIMANKAFSWWQNLKRKIVYDLEDDINFFTGKPNPMDVNDEITVLIPTSPILAHPDTSIIEETISTIRERLPRAEIIIMFDGVRAEQKEREPNYQEYIRRMLWKCNHEYTNVLPLVFNEHKHQAAMTVEALKLVKTPTILFVEHDTPVCEVIPFPELVEIVKQKIANMIRLHHEALILEVHKDLMLDSEPQLVNGIPMVRTGQWSQRPHIASTEFYRNILQKYFSTDSRTMIEDQIHGIVYEAFKFRGQVGWNEFKVWIYAPPGGNIKRSYHLDARKQDSKFEETFKF